MLRIVTRHTKFGQVKYAELEDYWEKEQRSGLPQLTAGFGKSLQMVLPWRNVHLAERCSPAQAMNTIAGMEIKHGLFFFFGDMQEELRFDGSDQNKYATP